MRNKKTELSIEDQKKFDEVKEKAQKEYKKINSVLNPFLRKKVNFNAKGLDHIKFKEWNKTRLVSDQYLRLKFLKYAPKILESAGTLQEFKETKNFERVRINTKWKFLAKPVKYYGFIAMWNYKMRVKIIVKKIEGGQPFFWSIMPFWKTTKDPITEETKKVFHEGDLEKD